MLNRSMLSVLLAMVIFLGTAGLLQAETFVVGHTGPPGNPVYIFFDELAKRVEQKSGGRIKMEVHPAGGLGGDKQLVESLRLGTVDIASAASNNMSPFTNAYLWGDLPYIFLSRDGAHKVWQGEIGEEISGNAEKDVGTKVLEYIDVGGFRLLVNSKRPLKLPADTKGVKFRVTQSPVAAAVIRAWGGNPTPIGWSETFTSVQQGVVDGLHLHPLWLYLNGFGKIVKYATEVNALSNVHVVQMNMTKWKALSAEDQKIVMQAAAAARKIANETDGRDEDKFKKNLEKEGVSIYKPTSQEFEKWKSIKDKIWDQFAEKVGGRDFINRIIEAQK